MTGLVLVVDDVATNVRLLEAKLTAEYYGIVDAYNGEQALEKARTHQPDVVLLDVMMPGMDGFEVCRRLKADPMTSHIPVVMVTALSDLSDRLEGLEAGADDFLTKPVRDAALFARLKSLTRYKRTLDEWHVRETSLNQLSAGEGLIEMRAVGLAAARVLVVDRSPNVGERLIGFYREAGAEADSTNDAAEAFERIRRNRYDLIVVGALENADPLRFCSGLRVRQETRDVPLILIGGEEVLDSLYRALDLGVSDYVVRPVDRYELLARSKTQVARYRYQRWLRGSYERNLSLAVTDPLTGVYNRRYLEVHLATCLRLMRANARIALVFVDLDSFKNINDTFGHDVGDELLRQAAARLRSSLRDSDTVARLGGDEFVIVLPEVSEQILSRLTNRVCQVMREIALSVPDVKVPVTISASVGAVFAEVCGAAPEALLKLADSAMYQAKRAGGNCARMVMLTSAERATEPGMGSEAEATGRG